LLGVDPKLPAPTISATPFEGKRAVAGEAIKIAYPEFEMLQLDNYTGKLTWHVTSPDGTTPPVKWAQAKPKSTVYGVRVKQTEMGEYPTPDAPALIIYPRSTGRAVVTAWGIGEDGSPRLLAQLLVDSLVGPRPPPAPTENVVPNVFGLSQAAATTNILAANLIVGVVASEANAATLGTVFRQEPAAGSSVLPKTPVSLWVSSGPEPISQGVFTAPGFRCLIVYETGKTLPSKQSVILGSAELNEYMRTHCIVANNTAEFRIFDQNESMANESPIWQAAMKVERKSLPWIIVGDDKKGFSGPLPNTLEETMKLVKQYGGA
jgi:hypothetical protein